MGEKGVARRKAPIPPSVIKHPVSSRPSESAARPDTIQQSIGNRALARLVAVPTIQRSTTLVEVLQNLTRGLQSLVLAGPRAIALLASLASGAELSRAVVRQLLSLGVTEEDVTDLAFSLRHPELNGRKLGTGDDLLIGEWLAIRSDLVRPELRKLADEAKKRSDSPGTRDDPAGPEPEPASNDFLSDTDRSYLERVPGGDRFLAVKWHPLDYPGKKVPIANPSPEKLAELGADPAIKVVQIKGTWYVKGAQQDLAAEMFALISSRVPERRANTGTTAVLTEAEFKRHAAEYDRYIEEQLGDIPSQKGLKLNKHAAQAFSAMHAAAAAQGVALRVKNSFRDRAVAEANAKKAGNKKAVASYSSHSLGLAVDLSLHTTATKGEWTETSTRMDNLVKMYRAPAYKWMAEHAAEHGWYPFRNEPWHWEYNPEGFRNKFFAEADDSIRPPGSPR
jgi:D-alanyl-D-alanine dipeptidase